MRARLALLLWAIAIVVAVAPPVLAVVLSMPQGDTGTAANEVAYLAFLLTFATVGGLVAWKRPAHPIGWLLLAAATGYEIGGLGVTLAPDASSAPVMVLAWVSSWTWGTGIGFAVLALLVFPDGRLPSPRWRSVVVLTAGAMLAFVVGLGFGSPTIGDTGLPNPVAVGGPVGDALNALQAAFPLVLLSALLAVVSIVVRWRRADGIERQQIKWLASAALIVGLALVLTATPLLDSTDVDNAVISTSFALLPLAMGIAVFRYRLWDIDRIISRTIGWALVTGLLLAVFGIVVLALQAAMENVTQGQTLAVAASTLVAAALFQPLRRRVQAAVDSRFDRAAYDAQRMAEAFAEDLRNEVHLPRITHELLGTIGSSVRPAAAAVWLREKGAGS